MHVFFFFFLHEETALMFPSVCFLHQGATRFLLDGQLGLQHAPGAHAAPARASHPGKAAFRDARSPLEDDILLSLTLHSRSGICIIVVWVLFVGCLNGMGP